jgi:hypothetical protein
LGPSYIRDGRFIDMNNDYPENRRKAWQISVDISPGRQGLLQRNMNIR